MVNSILFNLASFGTGMFVSAVILISHTKSALPGLIGLGLLIASVLVKIGTILPNL